MGSTLSSNAPTIIKKVKKGGHAHPHSSAWKVAYADFVTAMMAFFLLLWLLNVTTDEQKQGIADYFMPTLAVDGVQGNVGFTGGSVTDLDGPLETPAMGAPSAVVGLPPRTEGVQRERAGPSDEGAAARRARPSRSTRRRRGWRRSDASTTWSGGSARRSPTIRSSRAWRPTSSSTAPRRGCASRSSTRTSARCSRAARPRCTRS